MNGRIDRLSKSTQQLFCDQGDSGPLIMDKDCKIAGLMFGDMDGACGPQCMLGEYVGAGLVSDIDDIKASLKSMLR